MSISIDGQNGQNVTLSNRETKALAKIGVAPGDLGLPAVGLVLSDQQQAFVAAYVQNGGDYEAAASEAEYPEPKKDGRALMRLPSIQAGIRREQALAVAGMVHLSDKTVSDILKDTAIDPKVKIAAARVAYERAGTIQAAKIEAERDVNGRGQLAGLSEQELMRVILEAEQRIASAQPPIIDVTPRSTPEAPRSDTPPPAESAA